MRPIERIDNFIDNVNWKELYKRWNLDIQKTDKEWKEFAEAIRIAWKQERNIDMRIGQLLINLEKIPDTISIWYDDEIEILLSQGFAPEEVIFWTSIYDKEGNLRDKPSTSLMKDLSIEHVKNIANFIEEHNAIVNSNIQKAIKNLLGEQ